MSDGKRRAIEQRVTRISRALKTSSLLREAVGAVAAHFQSTETTTDDEQAVLDVVAYGLGSFCASSNAVYQLAFLVALAQELASWSTQGSGRAEVFDPVMNQASFTLDLRVEPVADGKC